MAVCLCNPSCIFKYNSALVLCDLVQSLYLSARGLPGNIFTFEKIPICLISGKRQSVHHHSKLKDFLSSIPVAVFGFLLSPEIPTQTQIWVCSWVTPWLPRVILPPNHSSVISPSPFGTYMNRLTASFNPCFYFKWEWLSVGPDLLGLTQCVFNTYMTFQARRWTGIIEWV